MNLSTMMKRSVGLCVVATLTVHVITQWQFISVFSVSGKLTPVFHSLINECCHTGLSEYMWLSVQCVRTLWVCNQIKENTRVSSSTSPCGHMVRKCIFRYAEKCTNDSCSSMFAADAFRAFIWEIQTLWLALKVRGNCWTCFIAAKYDSKSPL